ncbi:MAG: PepSY-like domain-containing protein [Chloroflexota bacterium]
MSEDIESNEIPEAVKEAFAARFPDVTPESWEVDAVYETEFTVDGKEIEVTLNPDGSINQIESEIDPDELPEAVVEAVKAKFPHCEIVEAEKVEKGDGTLLFEVDLKFEVHLTPEGKVAALGKDL